jgi:hypothetical protein
MSPSAACSPDTMNGTADTSSALLPSESASP